MGNGGVANMTENGKMFRDLCTLNFLIIRGNIFPLKRIHKTTQVSLDHDYALKNQIDRKCISKPDRRSLQDAMI